jgi:Protein of unknown function (DUF2510)
VEGESIMTVSIADLVVDDSARVAESIRQRLSLNGLVAAASFGLSEGYDLVGQAAEALASFLGMPIGNLVFWAWDRQQAVQGACRATAGRPGAEQRVVVGEHTLELVQRPAIHLDVGAVRRPVLDVVLSLAVNVQAIVIDVEEGRVTGTGSGEASSVGELGAARPGGEPRVLFHKEVPLFELPAYAHFDRHRQPDRGPDVGAAGPATVVLPAAGWYPDPWARDRLRFWNGATWTQDTQAA